MPSTNETNSLLCLFHHQDHAGAALQDLQQAGVPSSSITSLTGADDPTSLSIYGMPEKDRKLLESSLEEGAVLLAVRAMPEQVDVVEKIFGQHSAKLVDEFDREDAVLAPPATQALNTGNAIPVIEEELAVGKRTVDQGGVRLFRRIVEIPVAESVNLREEHVVIDRMAVDRPATAADLSTSGKSVELTETEEQVVVSKTAHVVEEVLIGKHSTERVEHIEDTVRRTQVEVEELAAEAPPKSPNRL